MKRLIGIYREKECSPGQHQSNDALLLDAISERLRDRGFRIDLVGSLNGGGPPADAALVFSMCQSRRALEALARWQDSGIAVVNSPSAARNTHRDRLPDLLQRAAIPFPQTKLVDTAAELNGAIPRNGSLWLKRGDVHASIAADVQHVASATDLPQAIAEFRDRGITTAAVQTHCAGNEVKFYGVGEGEFFHWFYSRKTNGGSVDEQALRDLVTRAAAATGLDIYGGDVIVGSDGELTLIDLNDWPSFAPCREAAADAIAELIRRRADAR